MEWAMTDFQFQKILQMAIKIVKNSSSIEEAVKELTELTKKDNAE